MASSLQTLFLECAHALDDGGIYAPSAVSATTVTSLALINATANASANRYDGAFVYATVNEQQRTVRPGGYAPSTGVLTIYPDWGTTTAALIFLTTVFPFIDLGDGSSYRSLINLALSRLAYRDYVELAITDEEFYSAAAFPWLDRDARLIDVLEPSPVGGRPMSCMWRVKRLVLDGPTPGIELWAPFQNATGTLTLEVLRPAHTLIESAGVWAENTAGLGLAADRARVDPADVIPAFMHVAYRALTARSPGRPYPKAAELADYWLGEMRKSRLYDRTQEVPQAPAPQPTGAAA